MGLYTALIHAYWQAVMTSFCKDIMGSHGFSIIPPQGLHIVLPPNPRLLVPIKSVIVYARKQKTSSIFEWQEEQHSEYPMS